jgi:hypothetical protein
MFGDFEVSKEEKLVFTKTHEHKFNKDQVFDKYIYFYLT